MRIYSHASGTNKKNLLKIIHLPITRIATKGLQKFVDIFSLYQQTICAKMMCGPNLHNAECGGGDRVGEVTTRGRHGAHNAHTALSLRVTCSHQLLI